MQAYYPWLMKKESEVCDWREGACFIKKISREEAMPSFVHALHERPG